MKKILILIFLILPLFIQAQNVDEVNGVALTNLSEIDGVPVANIAEINGVPLVISTLKTDLVSVWEFNETSGTNADDAHGSNDGTYTLSYSLSQSSVTNLSNAVSFSSGYVQVTNNITGYATNGLSIGCWFKASELNSTHKFFMVKRTSGTVSCFQFYRNKNSDVFLHIGTSDYANFGAPSFTTDTWYHVVVTYDKSNVKLYVNGSLFSTVAKTTAIPETDVDTYIGTDSGGNYSAMTVDQPFIFGRAISLEEIQEKYASGNGKAFINW